MSIWLDTTGEPTLGIAYCDRCKRKFPISQLMPDPNSPGLKVCIDDLDVLDPYRLAMRQADSIMLPFVRPDADLGLPFPVDSEVVRVTESDETRVTESDETRLVG